MQGQLVDWSLPTDDDRVDDSEILQIRHWKWKEWKKEALPVQANHAPWQPLKLTHIAAQLLQQTQEEQTKDKEEQMTQKQTELHVHELSLLRKSTERMPEINSSS